MSNKKILPAVMLSTLMGLSTNPAAAAVVYQATNLGGSLWEYSYHVDGPFDSGAGFRLLYGPLDYANVAISVPLSADWLQLLLDGFGSVDTLLDNTALSAIPASGADFKVAFDWFGAGDPGSQPYELFDANGTNIPGSPFATVSANVPEPASLLLVLAGLVALMLRNARTRTPAILARS